MIELIVWSDYLCPWCHSAAHRLEGLSQEFSGQVTLEWRSFLLRPRPDPGRSLEKFRRYTESWLRPASEDDSPEFHVWQTDVGPPSHSVPPHVVAKGAARLGPDAFARLHPRLLRAYFVENRDISDPTTLLAVWKEAGLEPAGFPDLEDPDLLRQVFEQHEAAIQAGANGVPAVQIAGDDVVITGAHPRELYRRWITRRLGDAQELGGR